MNAITTVANAFLNTLWQAVALAFLAWLGMRLSQPRLNAATRHIVWWVALAAIFFLSCIPRIVPSTRASRPTPPGAAQAAAVGAVPLTVPDFEAVVTVTETRTAVWPFLLVAIWAVFGACRITRVIRSYRRLCAMKRSAIVWERPLPGLERPVRILLSPDISSPVAVGFLHPAIMLPENLPEQLTGTEMDCVLFHESAHLARYDDWQNLIAQLVAAVADLHPVVWWILRQTRREREMACDEWVVAHTGAALCYADSLMRLVERQLSPEHSILASGIFTRRSQLRFRIEMLLRRGHQFTTAAARIPLGMATVALAGLAMAGTLAPDWIAFAQQPEFEVASIKHTDPKFMGSTWHGGPGTASPTNFVAENTTIVALALHAYDVKFSYQYEVKSSWMGTEAFDVTARAPTGATKEQFAAMLQQLLEQRFGLVVHHETRQLAGYRLVVADKNPKLKNSHDAPPVSSQPDVITKNGIPQLSDTAGTGEFFAIVGGRVQAVMRGRHQGMKGMAGQLASRLDAPVIDATGLAGEYDFDMSYTPEPRAPRNGSRVMSVPGDGAASPQPVNAAAPDGQLTLREALQQQLGLKLEPVKAIPVDVLVLDKANKEPTGN